MTASKPVTNSRERRVFISDCEGPISKNDNAFELSCHFIPKGDRLFSLVSKYDDVLADVVKKKGYKAGDTLKLIVPFLRVHGATNTKMKEFSSTNILLVPSADEMLRYVEGIMPSFIVSTSYEHFIHSLCKIIGFREVNIYCTRLDIDKYALAREETKTLRALGDEIIEMPMIEIPPNAISLEDFSSRDRANIKRLDEIFWETIPMMSAGRILEEINPVGGFEKANAVQDIVGRVGSELSSVMYVGDSITDVEPLRLVRREGGLTVSFNGNQYAIREAEIAILSSNATITSVIAYIFNEYGRDVVLDLAKDWNPSRIKGYCSPDLFERFLTTDESARVEVITPHNRERLTMQSTAFRKTVRGEAVGKLG